MGKFAQLMLSLAGSYYSKGWGRWVSDFVKTFTVLAAGIGAYTGWLATHDYPTQINGHYSRYVVGKVVSYSGELVNSDDMNAEDFSFKAKFQSNIKKFDVDTTDYIKDKNPPDIIDSANKGSQTKEAQFILTRLTKGNHCQFDIIVDAENDKNIEMQISWRGGSAFVELHDADKNLERGIKLVEKANAVDISQEQRKKWIENNSKIIGAQKK